ncbi:MAG: SBBP repeat-containing protein, partial [Candidatus Kariarchaeaceae archaeon]
MNRRYIRFLFVLSIIFTSAIFHILWSSGGNSNSDDILLRMDLGGSDDDIGYSVVTDSLDRMYVVGASFSEDFPVMNAYASNYAGGNTILYPGGDAILSSFNTDGSLRWSTYFGGRNNDIGHGIMVDSNDHLIITGTTSSSDFPVTDDSKLQGSSNGFLAKFDSDGTLLWSTIISDSKELSDIAVGKNDTIFVTGRLGGIDYFDVLVARLDTDGKIIWNTQFGDSSNDYGQSIQVDNEGNPIIGGVTSKLGIPTENSPWGGQDGFVAKLDQETGTPLWGLYLGGPENVKSLANEKVKGLAVDQFNNIYATGTTGSKNFLGNTDTDQFLGHEEAYLTKISAEGQILWNKFTGDENTEFGEGVIVDEYNNVIIGGLY